VRFWDSSALVPLLADEAATDAVVSVARQDLALAVWWATPVECASAIARLEREGAPAQRVAEAFSRLDELARAWTEVQPQDEIREIARRLMRVHVLRAADALQIAAAYVLAERRPRTLDLVTLDERVAAAARKEGFVVTEPRP
jgi:predicted nucleic acid-binding protein